MGGTSITFTFQIGQNDLQNLISSKRLHKTDSLSPSLFAENALATMKNPEFYFTDADATWSRSLSGVRMAVDRINGLVLYTVFSP